jgi:hypothetical protein
MNIWNTTFVEPFVSCPLIEHKIWHEIELSDPTAKKSPHIQTNPSHGGDSVTRSLCHMGYNTVLNVAWYDSLSCNIYGLPFVPTRPFGRLSDNVGGIE